MSDEITSGELQTLLLLAHTRWCFAHRRPHYNFVEPLHDQDGFDAQLIDRWSAKARHEASEQSHAHAIYNWIGLLPPEDRPQFQLAVNTRYDRMSLVMAGIGGRSVLRQRDELILQAREAGCSPDDKERLNAWMNEHLPLPIQRSYPVFIRAPIPNDTIVVGDVITWRERNE